VAKAKYKIPHTQIANAVLRNLCRVNLTKRDYYRFLNALFYYTFGQKNRQTGKERGKWMEWEPALFVKEGMDKAIVSRCKNELLALRVIRSNGGRIGFNWHFKHWKTEWYEPYLELTHQSTNEPPEDGEELTQRSTVDPAINSSSCLSDQQLLTQRSTVVDPAINSTARIPCIDAGLQSRNKGNKEINTTLPKKCSHFFDDFWKAFPHYSVNRSRKQESFSLFQEILDKGISPQLVMDALYSYITSLKLPTELYPLADPRRREQCKYVKGAQVWLREQLKLADIRENELEGKLKHWENIYEKEVKRIREQYKGARLEQELKTLKEKFDNTTKELKEWRKQK